MIHMALSRTHDKQAGFSLIELLVSLMLFTVVVVIAVGSLLMLIDANAKAQNMQEVMTNLSFALDSMTREIRTGYGYFCAGTPWMETNTPSVTQTRDCTQQTALSILEGGSSLTAGEANPRVSYRLANGRIERRIGTGTDWFPLTSEDVIIDQMFFTVKNSATYSTATNRLQPTVSIYIGGRAGVIEGVDTRFNMQTTVTRRLIDI